MFFTHRPVSKFGRSPFQLTGELFLYGMALSSSTFSFNLPPRPGSDARGLAYCTVPATSTQGAIRAEDKGKQAIGGVQMVRLSFSPGCDVEKVSAAVEDAVAKVYNASR
jgi:cysteine synthase A